jgi:hypothetical protein
LKQRFGRCPQAVELGLAGLERVARRIVGIAAADEEPERVDEHVRNHDLREQCNEADRQRREIAREGSGFDDRLRTGSR